MINCNRDYFNEFICALRKAYVESRKLETYDKSVKPLLKRGRNHGISSILEDYFACLICKELNIKDYTIFVDQPITIKNNGEKSRTFYPDIMICKKVEDKIIEEFEGKRKEKHVVFNHYDCYKCLYLCDIKTDVGWIRESLDEICKKHNEELEYSKMGTCSAKYGDDKVRFFIDFDKVAKYDTVIVMSHNGLKSVEELDGKFEKAKVKSLYRNDSCNSNCFLLTEGDHVNEYKKRDEELIIKPSSDYEKFFDRIEKSIL